MLLKEEFAANIGYLEPSINAMLYAAEGKSFAKSSFQTPHIHFNFRLDDE
jgi:hypothetical protein